MDKQLAEIRIPSCDDGSRAVIVGLYSYDRAAPRIGINSWIKRADGREIFGRCPRLRRDEATQVAAAILELLKQGGDEEDRSAT